MLNPKNDQRTAVVKPFRTNDDKLHPLTIIILSDSKQNSKKVHIPVQCSMLYSCNYSMTNMYNYEWEDGG